MVKKESEEIKELINHLYKNKKLHIILTLIIFSLILYTSVNLRMSNLEILRDTTSGEYLSNDLDSMYFYRLAQTQLELGYLPEVDILRSPAYNVGWIPEIIDDYLIWNYKILKVFNSEITFNYASTISAPIFFGIGLILFFFMCLLLTKSKFASLTASALLAYAPGFLFRSVAGFYDHDHVGVFAIFALVIATFFAIKYHEKNFKISILSGILIGFFTALVFASWGGAITFVLVFLPVTLLLQYLFNTKDKMKYLLFYLIWLISMPFFVFLLGSNASHFLSRLLSEQGLIAVFVFGLALIDTLLDKYKNNLNFINKKHLHIYSFGLTFVLGLIGLIAIGRNPLTLFRKAWATLIYPFFGEFTGRLSATVAENAQPYLTSLISQNGEILFWLFILGIIFLSINLAKNSRSGLNKIILSISSIILFFAILFSRISPTSIMNGENILSQAVYLIGVLIFILGMAYVYSREKFKINLEEIILFGIAITVVLNARAAVRSFFLITPFIALIAAYGIIELIRVSKNSKEEVLKIVSITLTIFTLIIILVSLFGNPFNETPGKYQIVVNQAQYVGPSANLQWQNAMNWTRTQTPEDSIFVHWWDYGYFVQTMGQRATVTDGGHTGGAHSIHYIGRYILTTPNPKTALSFMKTWGVDYLLIDPTEMGKYEAFSKIGSNDSWDRVSAGILAGQKDDRQTIETSNSTTFIYQIGTCVDEDISYRDENRLTFLPGITVTRTQQLICNSYLGGIILEFESSNNQTSIKQPIGVFFYNNQQHRIPIKNLFINNQMISFEKGIDAVAYVIPKIHEQTGQIDPTGATIYLSPRTHNSLMGRLYILGDHYNEYPTLNEANFESDSVVNHFRQYYPDIPEFVWYQGLRAPLKIWSVEYPEGTPVYEEFHDVNFKEGDLDYLFEEW